MNMFFFFFVIRPFIKVYRYLFSYYTNINVVVFLNYPMLLYFAFCTIKNIFCFIKQRNLSEKI